MRVTILVLLACSAIIAPAIEVASGTFAVPSTTGNFTPVTGLSFQPKVLILMLDKYEGTDAAGWGQGVGVALSATNRMAFYNRMSNGSQNADAKHADDMVLLEVSFTGNTVTALDFVQFNSDGFTLNAIGVSVKNPQVHWMAIGGADLTGYSLVMYQAPATSGTQSLTGAGFQPDAALFFTAGISAAPPVTVSDGSTYPGFGYAVSGSQMAIGTNVPHGSYTLRARSLALDRFVYIPLDTTTIGWDAQVSSFTSDGLTLHWNTVNSQIYFWVLYLSGPRFRLVSFDQPASSGTQVISGVGVQPKAALFHSVCAAGTGLAAGSHYMQSVAANAQGHTWSGGRTDNLGSANTRSVTAAIGHYDAQTTSPYVITRAIGTLTSWDSDGFTLSWTVNEATARKAIGLLMGDQPSAPAQVRRRIYVVQ